MCGDFCTTSFVVSRYVLSQTYLITFTGYINRFAHWISGHFSRTVPFFCAINFLQNLISLGLWLCWKRQLAASPFEKEENKANVIDAPKMFCSLGCLESHSSHSHLKLGILSMVLQSRVQAHGYCTVPNSVGFVRFHYVTSYQLLLEMQTLLLRSDFEIQTAIWAFSQPEHLKHMGKLRTMHINL